MICDFRYRKTSAGQGVEKFDAGSSGRGDDPLPREHPTPNTPALDTESRQETVVSAHTTAILDEPQQDVPGSSAAASQFEDSYDDFSIAGVPDLTPELFLDPLLHPDKVACMLERWMSLL